MESGEELRSKRAKFDSNQGRSEENIKSLTRLASYLEDFHQDLIGEFFAERALVSA